MATKPTPTTGFSEAQHGRISEAAQALAHKRECVKRLEGEVSIAKENLKIAKEEMNFALNDLQAATNDALSGKEPLPYLFAQRNVKES